jgi:hypothetical protein
MPRPLVTSDKPIQNVTAQEWLDLLKKEGITSLEQVVRDALAEAKDHAGPSKPGGDFWICYNDGKWGLCGPG